jgi:DNA-binding IclR family transcriptional regulator
MQLQPITPVAPDAPFAEPAQHGAPGSEARLKVLLLLAKRPLGLTRQDIADATGLDTDTTARVLTLLRVQTGLVACDRHREHSMWYGIHARRQLGAAGLARLREQAERGAA